MGKKGEKGDEDAAAGSASAEIWLSRLRFNKLKSWCKLKPCS
jgi:hypothetical protein